MDNLDIPVLTEVYKTKSVKNVREDTQISPQQIKEILNEFRPILTEEITKELKPKLEAELTKKLSKDLSEKVSEQLHKEAVAGLKKELMDELKRTNQSIQGLEKNAGNQSKVNQKALEDELAKKNADLLETSKNELATTLERLSKENADRVNLEIAGKVSGMQELAVSQARSQIANSLSSAEDGFKQAISALSKDIQSKLTTDFKTHVDGFEKLINSLSSEKQAKLSTEIKAYLDKQSNEFKTNVIEASKQEATLELGQFYKEHIKHSKDSFNHSAQAVSHELLQAITAYSQKLTDEGNANLKTSQDAILTQATELIKSQVEAELKATSDKKLADFSESLNAHLPDVEKLLAEKVSELLTKELPKFEKTLMKKIQSEIVDSLQSVKLVIGKK